MVHLKTSFVLPTLLMTFVVAGCGIAAKECSPKIALERNRAKLDKIGVPRSWFTLDLSKAAPDLESGSLLLFVSAGDLDGSQGAFLKFRRSDCRLISHSVHHSNGR